MLCSHLVRCAASLPLAVLRLYRLNRFKGKFLVDIFGRTAYTVLRSTATSRGVLPHLVSLQEINFVSGVFFYVDDIVKIFFPVR